MIRSFSTILSPARCFEQAGDARAPYVLVTRIDLRPARPDVEALLYGPWERATRTAAADIVPLVRREGFWIVDMVASPMAQPHDVILLVALVEHAGGDPGAMRALVERAVVEALDATAGMIRETRVAKLIRCIDGAADFANGGPNFSSAIELGLTTADVTHLNAASSCRFVRSFSGYGGEYCLHLEFCSAEFDVNEAFTYAAE